MEKAFVNRLQCEKIGKLIGTTDIRSSFYNREFLSFDTEREIKLRVYFISAAICHQTHTLYHPKLNLWGWYFMEYTFLQMVKNRSALLNPGYLSICSNVDLRLHLQKSFSFDGDPTNCTLDRLDERLEMLLEICSIVKTRYKGSISSMIDGCNGRLINDGKGIYEVLAGFKAFSDPHKKKITFFLKLATDAGLLQIRDPENLVPIMDYHMMRVLLRMGCVEVKDLGLREGLLNKKMQASDEDIRAKCIEAIRIIAKKSGHGILKMNDFLWPIGRSCCHEATLCHDTKCMKEPCTFYSIVKIGSHKKCFFETACLGNKDENYRKLWEPITETSYY
ncbi:MAG: hypothetical protein JW731_12355 [Bacteroidales bacterium]|nr:hypothetical protein [Bacteroidales bacterium]